MSMSYKSPLSEPIAIIGNSCRFAGGVTSPSKLWELLADPRDLSKEVPSQRFNIKGFFHPDGEYHGTTNSAKAYWLEQDHRVFDSAFFNITPKEAEAIDPQQRMLLEVVYEALESAGYTLQQYADHNVAVYAGVMTADYDTLSQRDDLTASQYYATGNARSIISNRISYFFNFRGPSMTIDTACSSSLVALHQSILSLRSGESTMACVAGANLMITPEQFIVESSLHMLSPSGHCRMWDANADGYARGEGVAALFLKPLSRALADGDCIQAIIRETGVNSDGRTRGITMPNPKAQAELIQATYRRAGLDPKDPMDRCQYFEAHGTGTQAGDPKEAEAICEAFFGDKAESTPEVRLLVGSVKTVIGHTEGAAGLAGVLKVVQSMRREVVPPNLHLESLNPSVQPFYSSLQIPTTPVPWPPVRPGQPLRASVNSFGFGGTNSHAIIERYDAAIHNHLLNLFAPSLSLLEQPASWSTGEKSPFTLPLLISASSQASLLAVVESYSRYLSKNDSISVQEVAWHLASSRSALPSRLAITASSRSDLIQSLEALSQRSKASPVGEIGLRSQRRSKKPHILGIFTGQGAQWAGMSKTLLYTNSIYRKSIRRLDEVLRSCPDPPAWSLEQEIQADVLVSRVNIAAISQPLCTALQIALVDLLTAIGLSFSCVVGHSSGEIAAAYAAGRLTARDAILISYYRGMYAHLAGGTDGRKGGMIAVGISKTDAAKLCSREELRGKICIAANNASSSTTLSGDLDAVETVRKLLTEEGHFARVLAVDTAYHSSHMDRPAVAYLESLRACNITPLSASAAKEAVWVSSVHQDGTPPTDESLVAGYWKDNMVQPVLFYEALERAMAEHKAIDCALEVGPHPALMGPATQTMKESVGKALPYSGLLDRRKGDSVAFSEFLGFMWTHFDPTYVDIRRYVETSPFPDLSSTRLADMPPYPWDHSHVHYRESRVSRQYHFRKDAPHELLGVRTRDDTEYELRWRNFLHLDKIPWIDHHQFQGQALLPASAYCVMALDAARVLVDTRGLSASIIELQELEFLNGITIEHNTRGVEILFSLSVDQPPRAKRTQSVINAKFTLTSAPDDGFSKMRKNFAGKLRIVLGEPTADALPARRNSQAETLSVNTGSFYVMMAGLGLGYSGPFRALRSIERRYNYSCASLSKFHPEDTTKLRVSPATLDSCLQSCFATYSSPGDKALWTPFLPKNIQRLRFNMASCDAKDAGAELTVEANLTDFTPITSKSAATITGDICIFNQNHEMEIQVDGLTVGSFASKTPQDDYELYLHTVTGIDPEDEIVPFLPQEDTGSDRVLVESAERVASFYLPENSAALQTHGTHQSSFFGPSLTIQHRHWQNETEERLVDFVNSSPYFVALDLIRTLGKNLPDVLPGMLPTVIHEARQLFRFQNHLGRVATQLSHRYPRMNVLGLTDPDFGLTEHVLSGLGTSFKTYTIGSDPESNLSRRVNQSESFQRKLLMEPIDLLQDESARESSPLPKFDLVVLSTSLVQNQSTSHALKRVREMMKPGAFLLLIHISISPLKDRLRRCAGFRHDMNALLTPPDWPDLLDECGFVRSSRNSDQYYPPGFSLIVRQSSCPEKLRLQSPFASLGSTQLTDSLLVIGGKQPATADLAHGLHSRLEPSCGSVVSTPSLDELDMNSAGTHSAVIILSDLDKPLLSTMTVTRLDTLRALMRPEMTVLWITLCSRTGDPEHAASFGFGRTMLAEVPGLNLQMLDLDTLEGAAKVATESFARLIISHDHRKSFKGDILWNHEPEVHIEAGRRLIPRVLPYRHGNDRVNASRRVLVHAVNSLETPVEIVPTYSGDGSVKYETQLSVTDMPMEPTPGQIQVQVDYSSVDAVSMADLSPTYICLGRDVHTEETVVVLSKSNASFISAPRSHAYKTPSTFSPKPPFISLLSRIIASLSIASVARNKSVLLLEPDELLLDCAREVLSEAGVAVKFCTAKAHSSKLSEDRIFIHPNATTREFALLFPPEGTMVINCLPEGDGLSEAIHGVMPRNCEYTSRSSLFSLRQAKLGTEPIKAEVIFAKAVEMTLSKESSLGSLVPLDLVSVPVLLQATESLSRSQVIDWRSERVIEHTIKPRIGEHMLSSDKTYVLVGLTRDLGQSLCRLFVEQGARHIVLASRNPNKSPKWVDELTSRDVNVQIKALDVTDLDSVKSFREKISETMPLVAGLVNGAMVLEDRVFAQMTVETFNRVMRPKTVGSKNLDIVFDDPGMEFYVMTSSFAAIGGHAGQSNYAAANMYMNGLAADRRRRGLVGSVLNIGVIYGLGFLHREKENLYEGLERDGYPPISERDIHHMFLEAIVAGIPTPGQVADLTTGLSRYNINDPNPLHWHRDPRFSHYTLDDDGDTNPATGGEESTQNIREMLDEVLTVSDMADIIVPAFTHRLEVLLQSTLGSITGDNSISELGVDSLVAVDIRSWVWKTIGKDVPVMKILSSVSIAKLCFEIAELVMLDRKDHLPDRSREPSVTGSTTSEASASSSSK